MRAMRAAFVAVAIAAFAVTLGSGPTFASPSVPAADPIQTFQNQNTGRCIDDTNSGGFRTFPCNGTPAQQWH